MMGLIVTGRHRRGEIHDQTFISMRPCIISIPQVHDCIVWLQILGCVCAFAARKDFKVSLTGFVIFCRPDLSSCHSAAAWGILRTAAVELAGQAWHGLDCSSTSPAPLHMKVMPSHTPQTSQSVCSHPYPDSPCTAKSTRYTQSISRTVMCMLVAQSTLTSLVSGQAVLGDASEAAGSMIEGNVRHGARLLRSSTQHLPGPYQLTPSPRGSFSSLVARTLPGLVPGPNEVGLCIYPPPLYSTNMVSCSREVWQSLCYPLHTHSRNPSGPGCRVCVNHLKESVRAFSCVLCSSYTWPLLEIA